MKKTQWIEKAAANAGMSKKQMEVAFNALEAALVETLAAGESVQVTGMGTFTVREIAAHAGRNPKTNETIEIPACRRIGFTAGKTLKEKLN